MLATKAEKSIYIHCSSMAMDWTALGKPKHMKRPNSPRMLPSVAGVTCLCDDVQWRKGRKENWIPSRGNFRSVLKGMRLFALEAAKGTLNRVLIWLVEMFQNSALRFSFLSGISMMVHVVGSGRTLLGTLQVRLESSQQCRG